MPRPGGHGIKTFGLLHRVRLDLRGPHRLVPVLYRDVDELAHHVDAPKLLEESLLELVLDADVVLEGLQGEGIRAHNLELLHGGVHRSTEWQTPPSPP